MYFKDFVLTLNFPTILSSSVTFWSSSSPPFPLNRLKVWSQSSNWSYSPSSSLGYTLFESTHLFSFCNNLISRLLFFLVKSIPACHVQPTDKQVLSPIYLQLIQLRLFLLERVDCRLLLLSFSSLCAFYRRVIRFDI